MDKGKTNFTQVGFQRRPGGRNGCGCCGLWFAGLLSLPMLAALFFFVI